MPSMVRGSTSLKGFTFGIGFVPTSNPSIGTRSMSFPSFSKNLNPFQVQGEQGMTYP